jgi:hypothetical protein
MNLPPARRAQAAQLLATFRQFKAREAAGLADLYANKLAALEDALLGAREEVFATGEVGAPPRPPGRGLPPALGCCHVAGASCRARPVGSAAWRLLAAWLAAGSRALVALDARWLHCGAGGRAGG